jgi:glycosyltransferase involved in cell wall biosynthesis
MKPGIDLAYSIADQNFRRTKSVGILNFSIQFLNHFASKPEISRLTVFSNSPLAPHLHLPGPSRHPVYDRPISGRFGRLCWDQFGVNRAVRRSQTDWLFLPKGFASFASRCPARLTGYLADVIPDYYQKNYPRGFPRFETWYFLSCMRAMLQQAEVLFTNSDFSRGEIERVARERGWRVPRSRTLGIGFVRPPAPTHKEDHIVVLASPLPHKRTAMAIEFLSQWQKSSNYPGTVHWIGRLPPGVVLPAFSNWKQDGRLEEPQYREAVAKAKVYIFTTEYEGFGMPPVEAVLAGACPVFSSIPPTREVMGETGCPFENDSYPSFAAALNQSLKVSPQTLEAWAAQLLARHNWDRVTAAFLSELQDRNAAPRGG